MSSTPIPAGSSGGSDRRGEAARVLAGVTEARAIREQAERDQLSRVLEWAAVHQVPVSRPETTTVFEETCLAVAGPGAPRVPEYAALELAAALGLSNEAGLDYLGNAAIAVVEPGEPLGESESRPGDLPDHRERASHRASTRSVAASFLGRGRCSTTDERAR